MVSSFVTRDFGAMNVPWRMQRLLIGTVAVLAGCTESIASVVTPVELAQPQVRIVGYNQHVQIGSRQQLQVEVKGMDSNPSLFFGFYTDESAQTIDPLAKYIAPIDQSGNISANSVGSVSIIARSQQHTDKTDTVRIYVDPPDASTRLHFTTIAADDRRSCGISATLGTFCWGSNQGSILGASSISRCGDGYGPRDYTCSPLPVLVAASPSFVQLAVGNQHTCGLTQAGAVYCWGRNQYGEVGTGLTTPSLSPVPVPTEGKVISLSATQNRTCIVVESGKLYCWGVLRGSAYVDADSVAKCFSRSLCSALPALIDGIPPVVSVSTAPSHTCAITGSGDAYCWGLNFWGELGDGTLTSSNTPVRVATSFAFKSISTAGSETCALDDEGRAFCWGLSGYPITDCGSDENYCSRLPVQIDGSGRFRQISAEVGGVCAISTDDRIFCLGRGPLLGLPVGTFVSTFTEVQPSIRFASLSVGSRTCAIAVGGLGYCWGDTGSGESGTGQLRHLDKPTAIEGPLQK